MNKLTAIQKNLLKYLKRCKKSGYTPTLMEICQEFSWKSSNAAFDHLAALERKGCITRERNKNRIRILK